MSLQQAAENFAQLTHSLQDQDLERPWDWQDYHEGVRFAFFRNYEDLRDLAVRLTRRRINSVSVLTSAQLILAQYQQAYRDLQAVTLGIGNNEALQAPADGEWCLWEVLVHIVQTERTFFAINLYALEGARHKDGRPLEMSDEAWYEFWSGDRFDQIRDSKDTRALLTYYADMNQRILHEFAEIDESELSIPVVFWESTPMPLRFRLHRFDSHLRQHTIQIEKILPAIGHPVNEAKSLLRMIYNALAEVESVCFGAWDFGKQERIDLAGQIIARTEEVFAVLNG